MEKAQVVLAQAAMDHGRKKEAESRLNKALNSDIPAESVRRCQEMLLWVLADQGRASEGLTVVKALQPLGTGKPSEKGLVGLMEALCAAEKRGEAEGVLNDYRKLYPKGAYAARVSLDWGKLLGTTGDSRNAAKAFQKLIQEKPSAPEADEARMALATLLSEGSLPPKDAEGYPDAQALLARVKKTGSKDEATRKTLMINLRIALKEKHWLDAIETAAQFRATTEKYVGQMMRVLRANEIPSQLMEFFGATGLALVFFFVERMPPDQRPKASDFFTFVLGIVMVYPPIKSLTRLHNQLHQARAASERVFELLATKNSVPEPAQPKMLHASHAVIEFQNLDFNYGEKPVLHNINLTVKAGQLVALVGASGSGKTTLANLLLRFYDPVHGVIKIGGVDLREVSTRDLRNQIAIVTQENILFNDTIRRNIELGRLGATNDEIVAAARHAYAYDFIIQKPEGFDAVIGEKGVSLSGGQRQRLAIARAVLKNAPILVLDEATSALDTESERAVQAALDELMKGRTTICIAHRLSTILHADVIVVLDQGRIVETGTHTELIQRGGIYQKLHELQFQS